MKYISVKEALDLIDKDSERIKSKINADIPSRTIDGPPVPLHSVFREDFPEYYSKHVTSFVKYIANLNVYVLDFSFRMNELSSKDVGRFTARVIDTDRTPKSKNVNLKPEDRVLFKDGVNNIMEGRIEELSGKYVKISWKFANWMSTWISEWLEESVIIQKL